MSDTSPCEEEHLMHAEVKSSVNLTALACISKEDWIVDSGASKHMIASTHPGLTLQTSASPHKVRFADNSCVQAVGSGEVSVPCIPTQKVTGMVMPFEVNLLSTRQLAVEHGIVSVFWADGGVLFTPAGDVVATLEVKNDLYVLSGPRASVSLNCRSEGSLEIEVNQTHLCKGHMSPASLAAQFQKSEALIRSVLKCESCTRARMTTKRCRRLKKPEYSTKRPLAHVSTDTVHAGVQGINGEAFFVTVLDEASGYIWTLPVRAKSEVAELLVQLLHREMKQGLEILRLQTDGGSEFSKLENFIATEGISHRVTPRYEHNANGPVESANRRITEKACSLMLDSQLPAAFWPYAVRYAAMIYNHLELHNRSTATPASLLYGKSLDQRKFHRFGAKCEVFIPNELRQHKFSPHSATGVFLGLDHDGYAMEVYVLDEDRVIRSRSVKVFPEIVPEKTRQSIFSDLDSSDQWLPDSEGNCDHNLQEFEGNDLPMDSKGNLDHEVKEFEGNDLPLIDAQEEETSSDALSEKGNQEPVEEGRRRSSRITEYTRMKLQSTAAEEIALLMDIGDEREQDFPASIEPRSWKEAIKNPKWMTSMQEEYKSLLELNSWEMVKPDPNKPTLKSLWVYKVKDDGRFKSRLTINGKYHVCHDTYASVGSKTALRMMVSLAASTGLHLAHYDIKNAFLYGALEEDEYVQMKQPEGMPKILDDQGNEMVCLVKKSLYGLKNAPRIWQQHLESTLTEYGFVKSSVEEGLWYNCMKGLRLWLYVDDIVTSAINSVELDSLFQFLRGRYSIKNLGLPTRVLGIQFEYCGDGILLHQSDYANKITSFIDRDLSRVPISERLNVDLEKEASLDIEDHDLYRHIVGALLYLVVSTRPDLSYSVSSLSKYSAHPTVNCLKAAVRCLKYVKCTYSVGIFYSYQKDWSLYGFSDTDHAADSDRISRYAYNAFLGSHQVSWTSKSLPEHTLSSCESELYGANFLGVELLFLGKLQAEMLLCRPLRAEDQVVTPSLLVDNASTVNLFSRPGYRTVTRHIEIKNLWIIEKCIKGKIHGRWIKGELNIADLGTKPLDRVRMYQLMHLGGMRRLVKESECSLVKTMSDSALVALLFNALSQELKKK